MNATIPAFCRQRHSSVLTYFLPDDLLDRAKSIRYSVIQTPERSTHITFLGVSCILSCCSIYGLQNAMPTTCRCQFISFFTRGTNCLLVAQLARAHCHLPKKEQSFLYIAGNHSNPRLPTRLKSANVFHLRAVTLSIATSHSSTGETDMIPVIFMQASMRQGIMSLSEATYTYQPSEMHTKYLILELENKVIQS